MAKSKSSYSTQSYKTMSRLPRVTVANATQRVRPIVIPSRVATYYPPILLQEDRRTFHPDGPKRAPQAMYRSDTQLVIRGGTHGKKQSKFSTSKLWSTPDHSAPIHVGFKRPDRVALCVRRKIRRQVLLAAGVGGKRVRPPKRTYKSGFHCN